MPNGCSGDMLGCCPQEFMKFHADAHLSTLIPGLFLGITVNGYKMRVRAIDTVATVKATYLKTYPAPAGGGGSQLMAACVAAALGSCRPTVATPQVDTKVGCCCSLVQRGRQSIA